MSANITHVRLVRQDSRNGTEWMVTYNLDGRPMRPQYFDTNSAAKNCRKNLFRLRDEVIKPMTDDYVEGLKKR